MIFKLISSWWWKKRIKISISFGNCPEPWQVPVLDWEYETGTIPAQNLEYGHFSRLCLTFPYQSIVVVVALHLFSIWCSQYGKLMFACSVDHYNSTFAFFYVLNRYKYNVMVKTHSRWYVHYINTFNTIAIRYLFNKINKEVKVDL